VAISDPIVSMRDANVTHAEQALGLEPGTFPFVSHFCVAGGAKVHYVDEGQGSILFMIHGNPTWSFLYRHVIQVLSR
jgi:haloalkane dehalogenase